MGNQVGVILQRATVGPLAIGEGSGDALFLAVTAERGLANVASGVNGGFLGRANLITNMAQYETVFGGALPTGRYSEGYEVAKAFFSKGGRRAWIIRLVGSSAAVAADVIIQDRDGTPEDTIEIAAKGPGTWGNALDIVISDGTLSPSTEYNIQVLDGNGDELEFHENIRHTTAGLEAVNSRSNYIVCTLLTNATPVEADKRPATGTVNLNDTTVGVDDNSPSAADIVGTSVSGVNKGLKLFRDKTLGRGVTVAPGLDSDSTVVSEIDAHKLTYFRLYFSCADDDASVADAITQRADHDSRFTAFYYPRAVVADELTGELKQISPCGHIVADYFRMVQQKGLSKVPAGQDFKINFVKRLQAQVNGAPLIDSGVAETLNASHVNPIWDRDGTGPKVWGARAATTDAAWKYINTAYVWTVIAERAKLGLDQVVFEAIDEVLYNNIRMGLYNMMVGLYDQGAFAGVIPSPDEVPDPAVHGFGVFADLSLMSADDVTNGNLRCEIWYRPKGTAETVYCKVARQTEVEAG